jgi:hypothetical protein
VAFILLEDDEKGIAIWDDVIVEVADGVLVTVADGVLVAVANGVLVAVELSEDDDVLVETLVAVFEWLLVPECVELRVG